MRRSSTASRRRSARASPSSSNDGSDAVSGTFAGLAQGATTDIGGNAFTISYVGGDGNDVVLTDAGPVCFASGTAIRTIRGDVPVERLAVGDHVVTTSGEARPIRWLGHRTIDCRRTPRAAAVMPVRIAAHAFGPERPARDLLVSPGHSICVDVLGEVLIPAGSLLNGTSVTQVEVEAVTYWHVELDRHDIVLAENLPAESYLEMGNRGFFIEAGIPVLDGRPDAPIRTHADFCRPFHDGGPVVEAVRARLGAQAARRLADGRPRGAAVRRRRRGNAGAAPAGASGVARDGALEARAWRPTSYAPRAPRPRGSRWYSCTPDLVVLSNGRWTAQRQPFETSRGTFSSCAQSHRATRSAENR